MTHDKPLLLVDVDGVLCPFRPHEFHYFDGHAPSDKGLLDKLRNQGYPGYRFDERSAVWYSPDNARRLKQLAESFELVWCTGWEDRANETIAPLHGLPELPVVYVLGGYGGTNIHWKFAGIREFVGDRPYAFIDDDIAQPGLDYAEVRNQKIPTLWLPITCSEGLTEAHVERLEEFAAEAQGVDLAA